MGASACSKKLDRGHCKREVVFWAEFYGRRENACVVHLGDILIEREFRGQATIRLARPVTTEREAGR